MIVPPVAPHEQSRTPPADTAPVRLVVLAGLPGHGRDALAERFGLEHRSLIPLNGRPLIAHVLQTAASHPAIASLAICTGREAFDPVWDVLTRLPGRGTVALVEARDSIEASVHAAAADWDGPLLVTTADHALLSARSIDSMLEALQLCDVAVAISPRAAIEAWDGGAPRKYLEFSDGSFAACDLYGVSAAQALRAVGVFRGRGAMERPLARLVRAIGLWGVALMRLRMLALGVAVERASRRLDLRLRAVVLEDGTQALDVDDEHSYAAVCRLLGERDAPDSARIADRAAIAAA